jgi:hypothetical protein
MTTLLQVLLIGGLVTVATGWFLRSRHVTNEHWLWKKQRLRRARLLATAGGVMATFSGAVLLLG